MSAMPQPIKGRCGTCDWPTSRLPCPFHDSDDDVTTVPDLTARQAEVVELLGLNPERRVRPRLTVHELATVDDVVRWAQRQATA